MMTALETAHKIRNGEMTALEAVENCITQIEKANPRINAVVETRYDKARAEASEKDSVLSTMKPKERNALPVLFGVPFTCKEMLANQGMKCTLGSVHRKDRILEADATVVQRIKQAGAILVGTTNVPEIGFWFECDNLVYGSSKNPYDPSRTPGGSSGGEAAIIATGASPFGIGSDVGGSIRMPAAFCGIFGHKASDRLIPLTGHEPVFEHNAREMTGKKYPFTVIGPLARSASDLETLFTLVLGPDGMDPNVRTDFKLKPLLAHAEELRVFYIPSPRIHGASQTEEDLSQAVRNSSRYLEEMGSSVEEADERLFLRSFDLWKSRLRTIEGRNFTKFLSNDSSLNYVLELSKILIKRNIYTLPALLTGFVDVLGNAGTPTDSDAQALMDLKSMLTKKLGTNGVLIMPVHPRKAPKLHSTYTRPFDFTYTAIINALGFPATSVPMGLSREGLPLSVQVIAAQDQDHLCLSVAKMLEIGFGGWQAPRID